MRGRALIELPPLVLSHLWVTGPLASPYDGLTYFLTWSNLSGCWFVYATMGYPICACVCLTEDLGCAVDFWGPPFGVWSYTVLVVTASVLVRFPALWYGDMVVVRGGPPCVRMFGPRVRGDLYIES